LFYDTYLGGNKIYIILNIFRTTRTDRESCGKSARAASAPTRLNDKIVVYYYYALRAPVHNGIYRNNNNMYTIGCGGSGQLLSPRAPARVFATAAAAAARDKMYRYDIIIIIIYTHTQHTILY